MFLFTSQGSKSNGNRVAITLALLLMVGGSSQFSWAHGDEDHGDQKPKTTSNAKGTVTHSTRLGDLEVMIKHPTLEPDVATQGQLFVTSFETNEPRGNIVAAVEIETSNGSVMAANVEGGGQPGVYSLKIPALPEGTYVVRANLTYKGETDTATFSAFQVEPKALAADGGSPSFLRSAGILVVFGFVILLLVVLGFFVWNITGRSSIRNEEAVSV